MRTCQRRASYCVLALVLMLAATSAKAEETPAWAKGRSIADWTSTALDAASIGSDTWKAWHAPDRRRALTHEALRYGITVGTSELVKHLVSRTRPDGSDRMSFWSEHTAIASTGRGFGFSVSVPMDLAVGYLRMAADKHYPSDVGVGAAVGWLVNAVVR